MAFKEWVSKNGVALLMFLAWCITVALYVTGGSTTPPGPPPPLPMASTLPPDHTALVQTDLAGKVKMTVTPNGGAK